MRSSRALIGAAVASALVLSVPLPSSAAPRPVPVREWSQQVVAPFSLAVDGARVLVADGATGTIGLLRADGNLSTVVSGVPGLAGLATRGQWLAYGSSIADESTEPPVISASGLNLRKPNGTTTYVDIHAYEVAKNPDAINTYGITDPKSCAAGMNYTGLVDAHVYAVASWAGDWLVADAGANAVFRVTDNGGISTLAVLPPVPVQLSAQDVAMLGLGNCAIGDTYWVEPVPTGVAIGDDGAIYVSTLPGFPGESASKGAVWQISPRTGKAVPVVSGLSGPTGIATSGRNIYVAELFGEGVTVVRDLSKSLLVALPGALSVATGTHGVVWAATMASENGPGKIVSITDGRLRLRGHFRVGGPLR